MSIGADTALHRIAEAVDGIGASGSDIETDVRTVAAQATGNGGIFIDNNGSNLLTVGTIGDGILLVKGRSFSSSPVAKIIACIK